MRLPEGEMVSQVAAGQDTLSWLKTGKKSCCLLPPGDSSSLLHRCKETLFDLTARPRRPLLRGLDVAVAAAGGGRGKQKDLGRVASWSPSRRCKARVCRPEGQADRRSRLGRQITSHLRTLSTVSNRFSCKLHASTLTKTKDRTISYRQIQVH